MSRLTWRYVTTLKGATKLLPSFQPFVIDVDLSGGKHTVSDVRRYQNGGSTAPVEKFRSYSIEQCKRKIRRLIKEEK